MVDSARQAKAAEQGLYPKYRVVNRRTGETVHDAFVLRVERDRHARAALLCYASLIEGENPILAEDLRIWVAHVNASGRGGTAQ